MFRARDPLEGDAADARRTPQHQQRVAPFVEIDAFVCAAIRLVGLPDMQNGEYRDDQLRRWMQGEAQLAVQLRGPAGQGGEVERLRVASDVCLVDSPIETGHVRQVLQLARRRVCAEEYRKLRAIAID